MSDALTIGLVQLSSSNLIEENIAAASAYIREAAAAGARFVLTPENTGFIEPNPKRAFELAQPEDQTRVLAALQDLAAELGIWLLLGSSAVQIADDKLANRSFLISDQGEIVARYDKAHMFDVDLPDGESYRESKNYQAGSKAIVAATPWGSVGMSICYDLRFPEMYGQLARAGASILTVPAAFTRQTGEAHWHILLRARAIETGCFVLAPAQTGTHSGGRETYGHSLVIDPWGRILADGGTAPGVILADLLINEVDKARHNIPSLKHAVMLEDPQ